MTTPPLKPRTHSEKPQGDKKNGDEMTATTEEIIVTQSAPKETDTTLLLTDITIHPDLMKVATINWRLKRRPKNVRSDDIDDLKAELRRRWTEKPDMESVTRCYIADIKSENRNLINHGIIIVGTVTAAVTGIAAIVIK